MDRQTHTQTDARDQYTLRIDYDSREVLLYCLPTGAQEYARLAQLCSRAPNESQSLDRKSNAQSAAPPHQPYRQISSVFNSKLTFSVGTFNLSAVTLADTARSL